LVPKTLNQVAALTASLSLMFALACSGATPAQVQSKPAEKTAMEKLEVVSTSNIVADWVRVVSQDRVDVFSLLPPNADPHTFRPGTQDVTRVVDADLVLSIGLSLEAGWLSKLVKNASQDPNSVVALGEFVDPIEFAETFGEEEEDHEEEEEGHGHGTLDPHFWFDPLRVKQAVNRIATQLSTLDPAGETFYQENAAAYIEQLDELDAWIRDEVATVPPERRLLVTSHDSFQYFAQRYGFEVVGAVMPATTQAEPTALELSELIEIIEQEGVPAVFTEKSHSDRLSRRVAEETDATLIGGLYTGSLSEPDDEAGTYVDMMRYNVRTIVEALR
jgi:ABC-type Zn uptake system ZnuABC Zn-binding protein ZnuA